MCLIAISNLLPNPSSMKNVSTENDFKEVLPEETLESVEDNNDSSEQVINGFIKKINKKIREKLRQAFPKEALKKIEHNNHTSIKSPYVLERLNDCFGIGNWSFSHKIVETTEREVTALGTLTIPEYGISITQYGGMKGNSTTTRGDVYKGAVTNALSKCCSYLEIGLDVYKGIQTHNSNNNVSTDDPKNDKKNNQNTGYKGKRDFKVLPEKEPENEIIATDNTEVIELKSKSELIADCKKCENLNDLEKVKNSFKNELENTEYLNIYQKFETSVLIKNTFKYCNTIQEWQKIHKSYSEYHNNDFYQKIAKRRYAELKNNPKPNNLPSFDEQQEMRHILEEDLKQEIDNEYITA